MSQEPNQLKVYGHCPDCGCWLLVPDTEHCSDCEALAEEVITSPFEEHGMTCGICGRPWLNGKCSGGFINHEVRRG
jgi:hypothetical protein